MKILYIHGFGTEFDPSKEKIKILLDELPKHFCDSDLPVEILGDSIDYCNEDPVKKMTDFVTRNDIDLIIGTSMGGWTASHVGKSIGTPWVAINPACTPKTSLARYLDKNGELDYVERTINLTEPHLNSVYAEPIRSGGLFLFDDGDELFDYRHTLSIAGNDVPHVVFEDGSHRFEHMREAIPHIAKFWNSSCLIGDGKS